MSWDTTINGFKSYLTIERSLSKNSIEAYIRDIEKFAIYAITLSINPVNIKREDIKNFLKEINNLGISARSQARIISGIKAFYKYLLLENYINNNPTELIESPRIGLKIPDILSLFEINQIIDSIDLSNNLGYRNKAIIEMLYSCGLRVSELINLKISNVQFSKGYIKILGKGNRERLAPVGGKALDALTIYINNYRNLRSVNKSDNDIIFLNNRGNKLTRVMIFLIIKKLVLKTDIRKKISPHTFRHSFATHMIEGGANLRAVQEMLGHQSITTTEIYTHLDKDYLRSNIIQFHPRY